VLQRVYVKVLSGKAKYQAQGAFKTWLFAVIRMTARDEIRRDVLRRLRLTRYFERVQHAPVSEPEDPTAADGQCEELAAVLTQLPRRQRQVLQLVFYHDMSLSEAAKVMSVSLGSARTHYDRGKKAVRRLLEEKSPDGYRPPTRPAPCIVL
jgi:RNA polymerase sigma factor (sigma-70 family)